MNELLTTLFQPDVPLKCRISYLHSSLIGHTFRAEPDHLKALVTKITELIVSEKTRCEGLVLLEIALQQCPILYADAKWSSVLLSVLQNRNAPANKELACKCLIMIVENQARNAAHEPDARNVLVPVIIRDVLHYVDPTDAWLYQALRLVAVCMKTFPNAVATQKVEELKEFILSLMDCLQADVQDALADCFAALPACIARSVTSETYKEVWLEQVIYTINSLHSNLNYFFAICDRDVDHFEVESDNVYALSPDDDEEPFVCIVKRTQQFHTLFKCLVKMLSTRTQCSVNVPINRIMQLLERIILVPEDPCIPRDFESRTILTMFPAIQNDGCTLLEAMLLNFPTEMEAISQYITKLFDGLLLSSRTNPLTRHQLSQLRSSTWRVLNLWIVQYGVNGVLHILQENIIEELRLEIDIRELPVEAPEAEKNQKTCLDMYTVKSPVGTWTVSSCSEALGVFRDMFYIGMPFLEQATVESITADVVLILNKIQNSKDFPFPYGNVNCRRKIYEVLLAIVVSQGPHRPFALRHSIGIFNSGLKDTSWQIVRTCQQGIAHLKNILHPKKHTLPGVEQAIIPRVDGEWARHAFLSELPWAMEENQLEQDVPNVSETVEIGPSYPENNESDLHMAESYSSTVYNEHVPKSQVNGENEDYTFSKPLYSYSEPMAISSEVEVVQNSFSEQSVEERMECDPLQIVEKDQPRKELNEEVCQNGDVVVSDEEMCRIPIQKTGNGECSVSSSEENSEEEEEEVEEEEEEESESVEDSPVKKLQLSSEDLESDDGNPPPQADLSREEVEADEIENESEPQADLPELIETEDKPPASPSIKQMCDTLVICENKDSS